MDDDAAPVTDEAEIDPQAAELATLKRRLEILPSFTSTDALLDSLAGRTLDRVDMLLSIYRDQVEQELAVMRDALVRQAGGDAALDCLIAPEPVVWAPRTPERPDILFDEGLRLVSGRIDLRSGGARRHGVVSDALELHLASPIVPGQLVVAEGFGARCAADLLHWQISTAAGPCLGRYDLWEDGRWRFVGQLVRGPNVEGDGASDRLRIAPTLAYVHAPIDAPSLKIGAILLPDAFIGRVDGDDLPMAAACQIAGRIDGFGWHGREIGDNGPYRWMSEHAGVSVDLRPGPARRMTIIGEDSVPHDDVEGGALTLTGAGELLALQVQRNGQAGEPWLRWVATADLPEALAGEDVPFALTPAPGVAKSPRDYASVDDGRVLSFSVRAIVWDVV